MRKTGKFKKISPQRTINRLKEKVYDRIKKIYHSNICNYFTEYVVKVKFTE